MKSLLAKKSTQVLENLTGIAMANGFVLPKDMDRKKWAEQKLELSIVQHDDVTNFLQSLMEVEKIRDYFVTQLKQTLQPIKYGIDRQWRQTQQEALEGIIRAFEQWYTRPLVEVPTGVGKSMIWGAIIRAFYDTLRMFGVEDKFEMVLFTSRIYIADQMIGSSGSEENDDEPLIYGDVKIWLPHLADDDIRILAGRSGSSKEARKNAKLTISCYQGLSPKILDLTYTKKAGLVILDESHRATNRVRIILDNKMHTAFFVGGSATTKGPIGNNPFKFFEAMKEESESGNVVPYSERLAYHASILDCIERKEFKPVRYINVRTSIDLSSLPSTTKTLPERKAGKLIAKNLPLMKQLLEELFLGDYPALNMVGTKAVIDRKWLVFVERIKIAEKLAEYCNTELKPLILKKYGKKIRFVADYVSGEMGHNQFNGRMIKYHNNTTTIMFSSDKLGEGADVPDINGIFSLRAYSAKALWKAIQEMGRGGRHVKGEDLLMVDGIFKSKKHEIASALTVFGVNTFVNGGLVAGYTGEREAETKVFTLLKNGLNWKQVWNKLTKEEKVLVPFIRGYLGEKGDVDPQTANYNKQMRIKSIEFVENEAVKSKRNFYPTWQEASNACMKHGIKNSIDYRKKYTDDPLLPSNPNHVYSDFPGWFVFLQYDVMPEGWETATSLRKSKDLVVSFEGVIAFVRKFRKTNPNWFKFYRDRIQGRLAESFHPNLVKKIYAKYNKERRKKAPKGWETPSQLQHQKTILAKTKTIKEHAEQFRKSHPEWFKVFWLESNFFEHYHPYLIERLRKSFEIRARSPKGWLTPGMLRGFLKKRTRRIAGYANEFRKSHPEWFKKYITDPGNKYVEHYHPDLVKKVKTKFSDEIAPIGWATPNMIKFGGATRVKKVAEEFRKAHPRWFKFYYRGKQYTEHYHPSLVKRIRRRVDYKPIPKNWVNLRRLQLMGIKNGKEKIMTFIKPFRRTNPKWFGRYACGCFPTECYHPSLAKKIKNHFAKK